MGVLSIGAVGMGVINACVVGMGILVAGVNVMGAHIYGLHAAGLIQEIGNAVARRQSVRQLVNEVHTHPTLSEVVEVAYKQAALALAS